MERIESQNAVGYVARRLAPEEIRPGGYVALLFVTVELEPMFYELEAFAGRSIDAPRVRRMPSNCEPLEVLEVCLPFVLVKQANGQPRTLDVRRCVLAGVSTRFGHAAFESHKTAATSSKDEDKQNEGD